MSEVAREIGADLPFSSQCYPRPSQATNSAVPGILCLTFIHTSILFDAAE
jgi:hypothetical protein